MYCTHGRDCPTLLKMVIFRILRYWVFSREPTWSCLWTKTSSNLLLKSTNFCCGCIGRVKSYERDSAPYPRPLPSDCLSHTSKVPSGSLALQLKETFYQKQWRKDCITYLARICCVEVKAPPSISVWPSPPAFSPWSVKNSVGLNVVPVSPHSTKLVLTVNQHSTRSDHITLDLHYYVRFPSRVLRHFGVLGGRYLSNPDVDCVYF